MVSGAPFVKGLNIKDDLKTHQHSDENSFANVTNVLCRAGLTFLSKCKKYLSQYTIIVIDIKSLCYIYYLVSCLTHSVKFVLYTTFGLIRFSFHKMIFYVHLNEKSVHFWAGSRTYEVVLSSLRSYLSTFFIIRLLSRFLLSSYIFVRISDSFNLYIHVSCEKSQIIRKIYEPNIL